MALEKYTRSGGILAVRVNAHVGPLPEDFPDRRGRFDTVRRTVYFAELETTAFAEVLQPFRARRIALQADADAVGVSVDEYVERISSEADGRARPWAISVDWQMSRRVHQVRMPATGWWVCRASDFVAGPVACGPDL